MWRSRLLRLLMLLAGLAACGPGGARVQEPPNPVIEYPVPGRPSGLTVGPDGNIWFTEVLTYRAGYLVPSTGFSTDFFTGGAGGDIITGPDGNLWLRGESVYEMTTAGTVRAAPFVLGVDSAGAIAVGSDGALWFTEGSNSKIGRTTTDWSLQEYPVAPNLELGDIIAGPDGNLWFGELAFTIGQIGRITPSGELTQFVVDPNRDLSPVTLANGPDGNIWFTAISSNRETNSSVGKVDLQGHFTIYPLPVSDSFPTGITAGADGNLWFLESRTDRIGRITTAGEITEFQLPTRSAALDDIVSGPDGTLWFSESGFTTIGSMKP